MVDAYLLRVSQGGLLVLTFPMADLEDRGQAELKSNVYKA
jgi:hypothetical protein